MGNYFAAVSEDVQNHLKQLTGLINLPNEEEALEILAKSWLEKEKQFISKINQENMEEVETFSADEKRGSLIMTFSGSLLTIGPLNDNGRYIEYLSIGLRTDVPEKASKNGSILEKDIVIGEPAIFSIGPISKSSPVYKIAVIKEEMEPEEEEKLLSDVTQIISNEFTEINKTITD